MPYASILIGSLIPFWVMTDVMPLAPPIGFIIFLSWRLMRPGLLPLWVGVPLGAFDDLFSGQPFGSAILLWSITMIGIELVETRFPWRGFWQDWFTAGLIIIVYIFASMFTSGATITPYMIIATVPQLLIAVLIYPLFARMVAWLDRFRLSRSRRIG